MIGKVDLAKLSNSSSSITKEILRFLKTTYATMWLVPVGPNQGIITKEYQKGSKNSVSA